MVAKRLVRMLREAGARVFETRPDTATVELSSGDYVFFCSVAGHRQSGMEGTLKVE